MHPSHHGGVAYKVREEKDDSADNRRIAPRISAEFSVSLMSEHNVYMGFSENLSEGGLFVSTHQLMPIGTRMELKFTLPTAEEPFTVIGEVRWTRGADAAHDDFHNYGSGQSIAPPGMGLRFVEIEPSIDGAIREFLKMRDPVFYDD